MKQESKGHGKNIVLCCDGTGNKFIDQLDPQKSNSNVVKLYTTLKVDNDQVAYYHPGVGTAGDPRAKYWIGRKWSMLKGLAFAVGFRDNVLDAYRYLMSTYNDGDRVYLFGFSRGAYTVRALAGLLDGYGLLCKGNDGHLPYAWNAYVKQHEDRSQDEVQPNERFKQTFSREGFEVHFMGIWDTVSSVGWVSTPLRLFNVARAPIIKKGRHAISVDERRCFYRDNLWFDPRTDQKGALKAAQKAAHRAALKAKTRTDQSAAGAFAEERLPTKQDLLQVWFPGVHSDIGGSYSQEESVLSNEALRWMLDEARAAGVVIKDNMRALVLGEPIPDVPPEDREKLKVLGGIHKKPTVSVVHRSLEGAWWLLEFLPHRYYDKDDGEENWRTPLGLRRTVPTGALVHMSVKERLEDATCAYKPTNLRGGHQSLQPAQIDGQREGSLYSYQPADERQPLLNQKAVRRSVLAGTTALDLVAAGLLIKGLVWLGHRIATRR